MKGDATIESLKKLLEELRIQKADETKAIGLKYDTRITAIRQAIDAIKTGNKVILPNIYGPEKRKRGRPAKVVQDVFDAYPSDGTTISKLLFIIKADGRFLSMAEIAEAGREYEPSETELDLKNRFSKHVGKFISQHHIVKHKPGQGAITYYGLPEYLDENGNVKEGFEPKED